jgi:hypothetical protein
MIYAKLGQVEPMDMLRNSMEGEGGRRREKEGEGGRR